MMRSCHSGWSEKTCVWVWSFGNVIKILHSTSHSASCDVRHLLHAWGASEGFGYEIHCLWDPEDDEDGNVQHIAENGLTPDEVEYALENVV